MMEKVNKLELKVASWYKELPHLPENGRAWLGGNVWWIVLIGVILGVMALITALNLLFFSKALLNTYGITEPANYGALSLFALVSFAIVAAELVISVMAISPLKTQQKRGWSLLFITLLLNVVSTTITLFYSFDFGSFIVSIIGVAIGGYFLFEIRDHFGTVKSNRKAAAMATTTPKKA